MDESNWTKFTKRININAPIDIAYTAWTTQEGLESWFLRTALFTRVGGVVRSPEESISDGDSYLWRWHGWDDSVTENGTVISANGHDRLIFTFHEPMVVTVSLMSEFNQTIVELKQQNIPTDENSMQDFYVGCGEGWTFYLANLKSILEGGLDLRNKNIELKNVVNS